jgi:SAM-dependent methyltransferase
LSLNLRKFILWNVDDMTVSRPPSPRYGVSAHYQGQQGEAYFSAQAVTGKLGAEWNLKFWADFIHPEDSVLDFGCGGGYLLSSLPGKIKMGVEINPSARAMAENLGVRCVATLDELGEVRFSRVISSHALEHVPAPLTALQQLRLHIADGGKLLLFLPLDDWRTSPHHRYRAGDLHRHFYAWTPQNLGNLLEEAGYKDICIRIITDAMPPNFKLAAFLLRNEFLRSVAGWSFGVFLRRRQLFAQATI